MRDPLGRPERYLEYFRQVNSCVQGAALRDSQWSLSAAVNNASSACEYLKNSLGRQYGFGMPIDALAAMAPVCLGQMMDELRYVHARGPEVDPVWGSVLALRGEHRESFGFAAITLALLGTREEVACVAALVYREADAATYLFDVLIKAFAPDFALLKKYRKSDKYHGPWTDPVVRALALPAPQRAAAMGAHMQNWCRLMQRYGCRSGMLACPRPDDRFYHFAFEVALAVCAYDIDDSGFRDHLYYPRELVDYYRGHVRHSRDAWRAHEAGAGIALVAPPLPPKAALDKSRRKGLARWVELVADGDSDATESVLEVTGKPRKIKALGELASALFEQDLCILADLKDDATLEQCCASLAQARALGDFCPPDAPPAGLARCEMLLPAFASWAAQRGYQVVVFDNEDDAWLAVMVQQDFCSELLALGDTLGLKTRALVVP